jgi:hypothetical protein
LIARVASDDWTLHDLCRTAATFLAKLAPPSHVIERILNHVSGSFAGVVGVYDHHAYLNEMRVALERWGTWARSLGNEKVCLQEGELSGPVADGRDKPRQVDWDRECTR